VEESESVMEATNEDSQESNQLSLSQEDVEDSLAEVTQSLSLLNHEVFAI
jgi:hypothetical protein